jgi:hypothetical protein
MKAWPKTQFSFDPYRILNIIPWLFFIQITILGLIDLYGASLGHPGAIYQFLLGMHEILLSFALLFLFLSIKLTRGYAELTEKLLNDIKELGAFIAEFEELEEKPKTKNENIT